MAVLITDETIAALGMSEETLRQELAVILFRDGKLTLARAARFAELPRLSFQKLLANRQIPMSYDVDEFERDLTTLKDAGQL